MGAPRPHASPLAWAIGLALAPAVALAGPAAPAAPAAPAGAQGGDTLATLRLTVVRDSQPVAAAIVRTAGVPARQTDASGRLVLRLAPGPSTVVVTRLGLAPDTISLQLRAGQDTAVVVAMRELAHTTETIVVAATRAERRIEDTPLRVEVVDQEEVAEKSAMTPGDITMMLNETSGLRVQTTSPSLGGAGVRIQGLRGRYALLLADGLPLYGGSAGGLGLLQIPPVDLGRAEIIKGTASALYGASALAGVINLVSRRPADEARRELLLNQTTRGGSDAVFFLGAPLGARSRWGTTLLASAHRQSRNDLDGDGWADMPGYRRAVVRPRLFFDDRARRSLFATAGVTIEEREGGTMPGRLAPDGGAFAEGLGTVRADAGLAGRWVRASGDVVSARASAMEQRHRHRIGTVLERDAHRTWFAEIAAALPRGRTTWVAGASVQEDDYQNRAVPGFDYTFRAPSLFGQVDVDAARWAVLSGSARYDAHSRYGGVVSPRLSVLLRAPEAASGWTARFSVGRGSFAPVPHTEETEVTGLSPLRPLGLLVAERATSASVDLGGPLETRSGRVELNATLFASRVDGAVHAVEDTGATPSGARRLRLENAPIPTRTWGFEVIGRLLRGPARVTVSYAYTRATEWDDARPLAGATRDATLIPRHTVGAVASVEDEERGRIGVELYYTGRQRLEGNPFRPESRPYVVFGVLAERRMGRVRWFVNGENLLDVRQTRVDPLVLSARGEGGRWTTDVWSLLEGRTVNGGVRLFF